MLFVDRLEQIHPVLGGDLRFLYAPPHRIEGTFTVEVEDGLVLGAVRATLDDERTPLAATVTNDGARCTIQLGAIENTVIVRVFVRPPTPIRCASAVLHVEAPDDAATQLVAVRGEASFGARSSVRLRSASIAAGESLKLEAEAVNDGTAAADDATLMLEIPSLLRFAHPRRRIEYRPPERWFVLSLGRIEVGARVTASVDVVCEPVAADGTTVTIPFRICERACDSDATIHEGALTLVVRSAARGTMRARLVRAGPYRHGETISAIVAISATGTALLRDVAVTLESGAGVEWSAQEISFGDISPHCTVSRLLSGVVRAEPLDLTNAVIRWEARPYGAAVRCASLKVQFAGRVQLETSCRQDRGGRVELSITNVGDGRASEVTVALEAPGVESVVEDSLIVDERPVYAPDGSRPFAQLVRLGTIGVGGRRTLSWQMHARDDVRLRLDAANHEPILATALLMNDGDEATAPVDDAQNAAMSSSAEDDSNAWAAEVPTEDHHEVLGDSDRVAREMQQADERVALRWSDGADARELWRGLFGDGPNGDTDLARYVLGARAFMPLAASSPAADAALAGMRSEVEAIAAIRLASWREAQSVGLSGFDFGTPRLRSSVRAFYLAIDRPEPRVDGAALEEALVRTIGAEGSLDDAVVRFRDALVGELQTRGRVDDDPAPGVLEAASHLHTELLTPVQAG